MLTHSRPLLTVAVLGMAGLLTGHTAATPGAMRATATFSGTGRLIAAPDTGFRSTANDRTSIAITIYNQNFGLVREVRDIAFTRGIAALEYSDVAQHIQPETVHVRATGGGLRILEQNYQYDLLDPQKLLEKYVGRTITVYRYDQRTQQEVPVQAEVLSVNGGPILRINGEITFNYPGRFSFPEIPENLIARPTLTWMLESDRPRHEVEVSYLANQMNWKAAYVLVVNENDTRGDLTGWVTLTNQSGVSYENAQLKLVAGEVRRVVDDMAVAMRAEARRAIAAGKDAQFSEESFFEYHLYTLDRPTTLRQNEQKQVTLLEAGNIGIEKRLIFYGARHYHRSAWSEMLSNQKVGVFLDFANSRNNGLGMPLPKGTVRVYKADRTGAQQFIGEDAIDHTPRDARVRIRMGEAFDVVGDRRQMEYKVISGCVSESAWEITLRNHKDERIAVDVIEPVGGDWEMLESSETWTKQDAQTFTYRVSIEPNGQGTIRYRVRVRWC